MPPAAMEELGFVIKRQELEIQGLQQQLQKMVRKPYILWRKIPNLLHAKTHWDFLPNFLSLHYYTTVEGVLGVRRGQAQGTIICLFGPLFFSQNGMTFKKATKIIKIH